VRVEKMGGELLPTCARVAFGYHAPSLDMALLKKAL
jgi:hypothetical protein